MKRSDQDADKSKSACSPRHRTALESSSNHIACLSSYTQAWALGLQRNAGNKATVQALLTNGSAPASIPTLQRIPGATLKPVDFGSYGDWVGALPFTPASPPGAVIDNELINGGLPDLVELVKQMQADCADVAIVLKHYYLSQRGESGRAGGRRIGSGVSSGSLKQILVSCNAMSFASMIRFYGGQKKPERNLLALVNSGLSAGDVFVWKRIPTVHGNFSGHAQTVSAVLMPSRSGGPGPNRVTFVEGGMAGGRATSDVRTEGLTFEELTGDLEGNAKISFERGGEEAFYGAGPWQS